MSKAKNSRSGRFEKENKVKLAQEAEWIQRARQGDRDAFDKLYGSYFDLIYSIFYNRARSISMAEELTLETFTGAFETLKQAHFTPQGKSFGTWLFKIVKDVLQKHNHELLNLPLGEGQDILWQLTREFPPTEQLLLVMCHQHH